MNIQGDVRWGIVGCGDVCEVKSGPAFNKVPNSRLVAVMRRDAAKAADYAARHGVSKFYSDADHLINDPEVNAVYVATPPDSHQQYADMAIRAGKPVYVEKPVTLNAMICQEMIARRDQFNGVVSVAHYRRELPLFQFVREQVLSGAIGIPGFIRITTLQSKSGPLVSGAKTNWRIEPQISGGGLFHDLSPHQLDIIYWIFGKPLSVKGASVHQATPSGAPSLTTVEAMFQNNLLLQGLWSFNVPEHAQSDVCEMVGSNGAIRFAFFRKSTVEVTTPAGSKVVEFAYPTHIQEPMINEVVRYFRGERDNPCSLEEAKVVLEMMDATL